MVTVAFIVSQTSIIVKLQKPVTFLSDLNVGTEAFGKDIFKSATLYKYFKCNVHYHPEESDFQLAANQVCFPTY